MPQQATDYNNVIIHVTLDDGTKTAFSFAEFLASIGAIGGRAIDEFQYGSWINWLRNERDATARKIAWSNVDILRRIHRDDPAVRRFRKYANREGIPL